MHYIDSHYITERLIQCRFFTPDVCKRLFNEMKIVHFVAFIKSKTISRDLCCIIFLFLHFWTDSGLLLRFERQKKSSFEFWLWWLNTGKVLVCVTSLRNFLSSLLLCPITNRDKKVKVTQAENEQNTMGKMKVWVRRINANKSQHTPSVLLVDRNLVSSTWWLKAIQLHQRHYLHMAVVNTIVVLISTLEPLC